MHTSSPRLQSNPRTINHYATSRALYMRFAFAKAHETSKFKFEFPPLHSAPPTATHLNPPSLHTHFIPLAQHRVCSALHRSNSPSLLSHWPRFSSSSSSSSFSSSSSSFSSSSSLKNTFTLRGARACWPLHTGVSLPSTISRAQKLCRGSARARRRASESNLIIVFPGRAV